jgi:hypothetical protein
MIELTDDQREIMDYLMQQVDNPEGHNVIVSGAAGSGKTTMVCELIIKLLGTGHRVAVSAMTGKATAVLRHKIWKTMEGVDIQFPKESLKIETISKITKESKVLGLMNNGETVYTNVWRNPKGFNYDVLFVDELSMVPHFISQWWQMSGVRVFGFGDECQLPEVTSGEIKKELIGFQHDLKVPQTNYVSGYGVKVLKTMAHKQLHKVLRSDNEIALLCNDLRDFSKTKEDIVRLMKNWAAKTDNIQYSKDLKDIEADLSWQIICYSNKMCATINNQLCLEPDYPDLQDKIVLFDNINPIGLYNGDTMLFGDLIQAIARHNDPRRKRKIFVCMKWQGRMPRKHSSNPIERNFYNIYSQFKSSIELSNSRRLYGLKELLQSSGRSQTQIEEWMSDIEEIKQETLDPGLCFQKIIERFYEVDRDMATHLIENAEPLPQLYIINCDFGYAITTHKSQGSEYENVCYLLERFDKSLLYTGISRAKKKIKIINLTKVN